MVTKKSKRDIDKELMFTKIMPSLDETEILSVTTESKDTATEEIKPNKASSVEPAEKKIKPAITKQNENKDNKNLKNTEAKKPVKKTAASKNINSEKNKAQSKPKNESASSTQNSSKTEDKKNLENKNNIELIESQKVETTNKKNPEYNVYNITYETVNKEFDLIFAKFNCCHCELCKSTIIADSMNILPSKFVAAKKSELNNILKSTDHSEIKTVIIQSIFKIMSNPPH